MYSDICFVVCHPLIVPHVCGTNEGVINERVRDRAIVLHGLLPSGREFWVSGEGD